jgi:putative hemolysin
VLFDLVLLFSLVAANGLFSATEIAVISLRKTRVTQLVDEGRRGAHSVAQLRAQPESFLATVQVGITAVGAAAAVIGEGSIGERVAGALRELPALARYASPLAFTITIVSVTFLSVVLGELVPKSLALRAPEGIALVMARPLLFLSSAARPVVWLLTAASNVILKVFGDETSFTEARHSPDELEELVEEAARAGDLDDDTADLATRALEMRDLTAEQVMTPRVRVRALPIHAPREDVLALLTPPLPDRIALYEGNIDHVVGYVDLKQLCEQTLAGRPFSLAELMHPVLLVPPSLSAMELLGRMKRERTSLAVVLDEAGGTHGLVALEDLLEELVDEVSVEHTRPRAQMDVESSGAIVVNGDMPVRDLNRAHGLELPESEAWSTVAGLCLDLAGVIPAAGTRLQAGEWILEVVEADGRKVKRVRVMPARVAASVSADV